MHYGVTVQINLSISEFLDWNFV